MKQIFCFLFALAFGCNNLVFAQQTSKLSDTLVQRLGNQFAADSATASLSVGILYKGQSQFYNFGKDVPTSHSVYEIGSLTKTFVSVVLAHAVKEGKVSLNDDIRKYLNGSYPNLAYDGHPILLLHLANTSSALPDNLGDTRDTGFSKQSFFSLLSKVSLDTLPGTRPRHSNAAAMLLSFIMESVYKEPIDILIRRYVLDPLQMNETSFPGATLQKQMLQGYNEKGIVMPYLISPLLAGTGSMRSTANDMTKYLDYLQRNQTPESNLVLSPSIFVDAGKNTVTQFTSIDSVNDRVYAVSLNWLQYHPAKNSLRIWTDGGTPGFRSYIVLYKEVGLAMIFLSNRTGEHILDKIYSIGDTIFRSLL